jgi:hypothetical protein
MGRKYRYRYQLLAPVPEIDGEPGDVFVWAFPNVYLVRYLPNFFGGENEAVIRLRVKPGYWWFILSKYEERFLPLDVSAPPVSALAHQAAASQNRSRGSARRSALAEPSEAPDREASALASWPGPDDPPPLRRLK